MQSVAHEDLPGLQDEFDNDIANLEKRRNAEIEERAKKVEADLAELEAEGEVRLPESSGSPTGGEYEIPQQLSSNPAIARLSAITKWIHSSGFQTPEGSIRLPPTPYIFSYVKCNNGWHTVDSAFFESDLSVLYSHWTIHQ